jgi:hypothetical protein
MKMVMYSSRRPSSQPFRRQFAFSSVFSCFISRHKRNQAEPEGFFLKLQRRTADIDHKTINQNHPDQRVVVEFTRQGPAWIELGDFQGVLDASGLGRRRALADAEQFAELFQRQMRSLRFVVQKVAAADDINAGAGPLLGFPLEQRRGALAAERRGQFPGDEGIFLVQIFAAEFVNVLAYLGKDRLHCFGGFQGIGHCSFPL